MDRPLSRANLLEIVDVLVVGAVARAEKDAGRLFIHQRDDAVLELGRGVALGVDVGDLLHLQRAFQGHAVMHLTAEEKHRPGVAIFFRHAADVVALAQDGGDLVGERLDRVDHLAALRGGEEAHPSEEQAEGARRW